MRTWLDRLYAAAGVLAILLLIAIGVLTVAQMVARLLGSNVPSADDFATFAMAGSLFLGLAHTFRSGGHVRVLTLRQALPPGGRWWLEIACLAGAAATLAWILWFTQDMIRSSYLLNERSIGMIPVPTWIPMCTMFAGMLVFLVAILEDLVVVARGGRASYANEEEKEGLPSVHAE
jgi:TRAP-type C4-dicarboxylate transport system permease small subunit